MSFSLTPSVIPTDTFRHFEPGEKSLLVVIPTVLRKQVRSTPKASGGIPLFFLTALIKNVYITLTMATEEKAKIVIGSSLLVVSSSKSGN